MSTNHSKWNDSWLLSFDWKSLTISISSGAWWWMVQASERNGQSHDTSLVPPGCITLGKFLNFFVPQFSHLWNGKSSTSYSFVRILSLHVWMIRTVPGTSVCSGKVSLYCCKFSDVQRTQGNSSEIRRHGFESWFCAQIWACDTVCLKLLLCKMKNIVPTSYGYS